MQFYCSKTGHCFFLRVDSVCVYYFLFIPFFIIDLIALFYTFMILWIVIILKRIYLQQ